MRVAAANAAWAAHAAVGARRWRRMTRRVRASQEGVLARILRPNAGSEFGREHGFTRVRSPEEYRRRVPIRGYDELAPWIDRAAAGEERVLTVEPVTRFGVSSGTTRASKLIPYTPSLLREFQAGIAPWAYALFRRRPELLRRTCYWSITPVAGREERTSGGIPVGFDDERRYLGRAARRVLETVMPVPAAVSRIGDVERFRYATLRLLLEQEALGWVSVWNPSFLTLLVEPLVEWREELLADLEAGTVSREVPAEVRAAARARPERARQLRELFDRRDGDPSCEEVWPRLRLVSCWADAAAADALPALRDAFPSAAVERKGLVATEAFVSFPLTDELAALSLASHFFEFCEGERVRLADELERGGTYSVVVTTGGGLYRYRLGDLVEVVGFVRGCPLLRFVGREDGVVDLRGEKLNETFVRECVGRVLARRALDAAFWLVAPAGDGHATPSYTLFLESAGDVAGLDAELDAELRRAYHYDYCRRLGQLGPSRVFLVQPGEGARNRYLSARVRRGQRLGDVKPTALDSSSRWAELLPGRFV